jgi:CO dehydrogenase/acetyl-CoA synthase beta subunit
MLHGGTRKKARKKERKKEEEEEEEEEETHTETPTSVAAISSERMTVLFRASFLPRP